MGSFNNFLNIPRCCRLRRRRCKTTTHQFSRKERKINPATFLCALFIPLFFRPQTIEGHFFFKENGNFSSLPPSLPLYLLPRPDAIDCNLSVVDRVSSFTFFFTTSIPVDTPPDRRRRRNLASYHAPPFYVFLFNNYVLSVLIKTESAGVSHNFSLGPLRNRVNSGTKGFVRFSAG